MTLKTHFARGLCPLAAFTFIILTGCGGNDSKKVASNESVVALDSLAMTFEVDSLAEESQKKDTVEVDPFKDLTESKPANCYIVSEPGCYKFKTVKGNSSTSVGAVASAVVLWESFGTDIQPLVGDLIAPELNVKDGYIEFETNTSFKEGNAVVAAKDTLGNILWSWHIWMTDQPERHVYNNQAGVMMDRNLGATSSKPGDVEALGLLYQWGRKDPFLGGSSLNSHFAAVASVSWPAKVETDSQKGTVAFVTANPMTFVCSRYNDELTSPTGHDWHHEAPNKPLWSSKKTIYDPCPSGWRVPDGGKDGVWKKAGFAKTEFDSANMGISFAISSPSSTWYPAAGWILGDDARLYDVGYGSYFWSVTQDNRASCYMTFFQNGTVITSDSFYRSCGFSVRCFKE